MAAKRHHKSHRKEHITKHDREVDRANLKHAHAAKMHHGDGHHEKMEHHDPRGHHSPHHSSSKSRMEYGSDYYDSYGSRKESEAEHAGMIREDHRAVANLPQEVIMRPYRKGGYGIPEELDDTIEGVDRQIGFDDMKRKEHFKPHKY